jgi:hypothetical protein
VVWNYVSDSDAEAIVDPQEDRLGVVRTEGSSQLLLNVNPRVALQPDRPSWVHLDQGVLDLLLKWAGLLEVDHSPPKAVERVIGLVEGHRERGIERVELVLLPSGAEHRDLVEDHWVPLVDLLGLVVVGVLRKASAVDTVHYYSASLHLHDGNHKLHFFSLRPQPS